MADPTLHEKLVEIQQCLKAPKDKHNKFGDFNYRSYEGIIEALKPLLAPAIWTADDEMVLLGDRYYCKATVCISLNGERICCTAYAREADQKKGMDPAQVSGSISSYARKYAAQGLLLLDDGHDPDSEKPAKSAHSKTKSTAENEKAGDKKPETAHKPAGDGAGEEKVRGATDKQRGFIWSLCKENGLNKEESKKLLDFATDGYGLNIQNASIIIDRMVKDWDGLIDDYLHHRESTPDNEPPPHDDDDIPI